MTETSLTPTSPAPDELDPLLTVAGCVSALQDGSITSSALVERALNAIDRTQVTLNAFRVVCAESARAQAGEADRRLAAGECLPLLGVPVAIKDDVELAGHATAFGCAGEFPIAQSDCELVRRLRAAGAVIVGKTNSPEVGLYPFTEGEAFGVTRNPWSLDHTPGGSSGGSAAAVAAGLVPVAMGSDGAGSVRIPAAWCHLVGVKPQRDRIPTTPEHQPFNGLTCLGPLTRTVADAALMLDVLATDSPDAQAPPGPFAAAAARDPGQLRIGLALNPPISALSIRLDLEVRAGVERIGAVLRELGHTMTPAKPRYRMMGLALIARGEAGVYEWAKRVPDPEQLDARTRHTIKVGGRLAKRALPRARRAEPRMAQRVGAVFEDVDVLLMPTTASRPLRVGAAATLGSWRTQRLIAAACPYAWPWNLLGWPAISVPAGFTWDGLPLGVQLMGPANSEPLLFSLAGQLERAERWQLRLAPHLAVAQA